MPLRNQVKRRHAASVPARPGSSRCCGSLSTRRAHLDIGIGRLAVVTRSRCRPMSTLLLSVRQARIGFQSRHYLVAASPATTAGCPAQSAFWAL